MTSMKKLSYSTALILSILGAICVYILKSETAAETGMAGIVIMKNDGNTVKLSVKTATTALQRQHGLMYVKKLDGYDGMLFDFQKSRFVNMWMKNTFIPLDMLFFDASGKLVCIHENTVPHDETPLGCHKPTIRVLEIKAGGARDLGIAIGDTLQ